ncbi:fasciclin domain-containing protein [Bizionia sediminis]|uniref:Fasciclin domain-containing protein n=1 Tax=Bizionia sediminis TaxID=1737064 RepID=A0ABW5KPN5_9FLAO
MKTLTALKRLSAALLVVLFVASCSSDDDNNVPTPTPQLNNIVDLASANPDLSSLVSALQAADGNLVSVLQGSGPFTVLAPTNEAFASFLADNGFASLDAVPTDVLSQILLNHVISGSISSSNLISQGSGYASTNATGVGDASMSLYFNTSNGVVFNGVSTVTTADIFASNGLIHVVDAVIGLPDVVDFANANPNLDGLSAALLAADGNLDTVLRGDGPFTVLAPDNNAFSTFLDDNGLNNLGAVPTDLLADILLNHVVSGAVFSGDLANLGAGYTNTNSVGPNGNNLSLYFNTSNGVVFNGTSTVSAANIVAKNGVIHVVDAVIGIPTVVTFATADPNFSTLVQALTALTPATDFASILSRTEGGNPDGINPEFTVFAPTNAAFAALPAIPDEPALTDILLYHVVKEANVTSGDLTNPGDTVPTTLQGGSFTITLPGTNGNIADVTDGSGASDIGIIAVDVQAGNGVIHVLNKVMLPN